MTFSTVPTIWKYVGAGVLVLALIAAIIFGVKGLKEDERAENNQLINSGELIERGAAATEVINHVEDARDAVDNPTPDERIIVCEKYDRNCQNGQ